MEKVLRSVLQKQSEVGSVDFQTNINYVFGSQGIYTDMFSGLNLEEELRIGGQKQTIYETDNDNFKITEKYYLNNSENIYYELETSINKKNISFLVDNEDNFLVQLDGMIGLTPKYSFLLFEKEVQDFSDNFIEITLSSVKNEVKTLLKTKQIFFSEDNNNNKIISEFVF